MSIATVIPPSSAPAPLQLLRESQQGGAEAALLIAGLWMPEMNGIDFLVRAHELFPDARRLLLVTYGEVSTNEPTMRATALGQLDAYVNKPWTSPEESLYLAVGELLSEWAAVWRS